MMTPITGQAHRPDSRLAMARRPIRLLACRGLALGLLAGVDNTALTTMTE